MTQDEKDIILKKIDSIYNKVVKASWDYMEGRDDALSELRVFIDNMNLRDFTQERVFDTDDEYTWKLIGSTYKNIPLLEARDEDGAVITNDGQNYGKGGAII